MSRKQHELEGRLDDVLTRITKETQEIKDLEQQLTDGQIAANEALKRDLEGIISGLQEYLHGVNEQARRSQSDWLRVQRDKNTTERLLQDKEQQLGQLRETARNEEVRFTQELMRCQEELEDLRKENVGLRKAQVRAGAFEAELEARLRERGMEAGQLREELDRLHRLSQLEHSALQVELQKERQAKESAQAHLRLAAEMEAENNKLRNQLAALQREKGELTEKVVVLQNDVQRIRREMLCPEQVVRRLEELRRNIAAGPGVLSSSTVSGEMDPLTESMAGLQDELHRTLSAALRDRDEAQRTQDRLAQDAAFLRDRLRKCQQEYHSVCEEAEHARTTKKRDEEAELMRLREELQATQEELNLMRQRLQQTESERDRLLTDLEDQDKQIKAEEIQTQEQLQSLDLELQELRRSFTAADLMAAKQLKAAKDQVRSLHSTVQKIGQERAEDAEELVESRLQAAEAMRELTKAEADIQTLEEQLQDRVNMINMDSGVARSSVHQKELARLNRALKRQQAQIKRLRDHLARAKEDNSGSLEELFTEIEALRGTLLQQSNYLSSFSDVPRSRGYWYYIPPYQNPPSLGSQGTQDSGLGSQLPPPTTRGRCSGGRQHKETRPLSSTGPWLYAPDLHESHAHGERDPPYGDSDGESDEGDSGTQFTPPPGSVIYTMPPDGTPLPQGTVIYAPPLPGLSVVPGAVFYGPPPEGVRLVYGPPPSSMPIPLIPPGTLHCNVPGHQDMERSLREAERSLREQQSGRVVSERELLRLEEQRSELQLELKKLQRAVSRLRRHRRLLESSASQTDEEQSALEELGCLEKTLQKRRAQLREADHLMLEVEAALKDTTAKNKECLQRHCEAEKRLEEKQCELEMIERRTRDSNKHLVQAKQQLRDLQEEVKEQERCKRDQENTLRQIEKIIAARDAEFQEVNRKLEKTSTKLEDLQEELRRTQSLEERLLKSCRDSEELQHQHKKELEHMHLQQEELSLLGRKLEQWREEETVVRARVEQQRQGLADALRQGQEESRMLQQRTKELHTDIQTLTVQKGEMESQLSERKSRLTQYKKEEQQAKETVQDLQSVINKHKADLKNVLEMIQLEKGKLEGLKVQHRHKLDQLEKTQDNLLQVQVELQAVQVELQEQQVEQQQQRRLQEQQTLALREEVNMAATQRSNLLEQCASLETRRTHTQRSLEEAEGGAQAAEEELLKLKEELTKLKQERRQANNIRQEINRNTATVQQQLQEETEELNNLKEEVADSQLQLEEIRKEVEVARREWDGLVKLQQEQKDQLQDRTEKIQRRQQRVDRLQRQLNELEDAVAKKQAQLEQQEQRMKSQQQQSTELEELHRRQQQKLQSQLQTLEGALAQRVEKMEQVTAAVEDLEEKRRFLQGEREHCALLQDRITGLEEELAEREVRLRASTEEQREVRGELQACRTEFQHLQETLATERKRRQALKSRSLTDRDKLLQAEKERERLQKELVVVDHAAQENLERSKRLQHELSSASQELDCLKHKLRGEGNPCQQELKDTVHSLRSEVEAELDSCMTELTSQLAASSDTDSLKENRPLSALSVGRTAYSTKDEQWRGEVLRERLRQHEDHLKAQLRRSMFSQQEALSLRRQQTEGSIQGLRRRVDKLDQLLGKSSYLSDSEVLHKYSCSDAESSRSQRSRERSLSPLRLDCYVAEKDGAHLLSQVH